MVYGLNRNTVMEGNCLQVVVVGGSIILKCVLSKWGVKV